MSTAKALDALLSLQWGNLLDLAPLDLMAFLVMILVVGLIGMTVLIWLFVSAWNLVLKLQK